MGLERLAATHLILADALDALVTSLERRRGALAAGHIPAASSQAAAARQNGHAVLAEHSALATAAAVLNDAWTRTIPTVRWGSVSLSQAQSYLGSALGDLPNAPSAELLRVVGLVDGLTQPWLDIVTNPDPRTHPLLRATALPALPTRLFDPAFLHAWDALAESLARLFTAGNA